MSKHSSAPIPDFSRASFARARRSVRRRSKLMRSSQSTAIVPYVFRPMMSPNGDPERIALRAFAKLLCDADDVLVAGNGHIFERWRERNRHVHGAQARHGRV